MQEHLPNFFMRETGTECKAPVPRLAFKVSSVGKQYLPPRSSESYVVEYLPVNVWEQLSPKQDCNNSPLLRTQFPPGTSKSSFQRSQIALLAGAVLQMRQFGERLTSLSSNYLRFRFLPSNSTSNLPKFSHVLEYSARVGWHFQAEGLDPAAAACTWRLHHKMPDTS